MKTANDVNTENNVNTEATEGTEKIENSSLYGVTIGQRETADWKVIPLPDGTFKKQMKYKEYLSRQPKDMAEEDKFYVIFNDSDSDLVTQLKNMVGKQITIANIFMTPYDKFEKTTGEITDAVNTTIEDTAGNFYATSSKSVYHKLLQMMKSFGKPDSEKYIPIKVEVTGTKRTNGVQIDLKYKGRLEQTEKQ